MLHAALLPQLFLLMVVVYDWISLIFMSVWYVQVLRQHHQPQMIDLQSICLSACSAHRWLFTVCSVSFWRYLCDALSLCFSLVCTLPHSAINLSMVCRLRRRHTMTFNPSARPAFYQFHKKNAKRSNLQRSLNVCMAIGVSPCSVNQRMGNVLVAFTSVFTTFHWRILQISRHSTNVILAFYNVILAFC